MLPSCAVMVLNWNGYEALAKCLPSVIKAAAAVEAEVWVVDSDSHDNSATLCREEFPSVRFEALGVNKSLAGYNIAASRCDKDVIVCLDNDVIVKPDFLQPLLSHFERSSDVFAVSSEICKYPPTEGRDVHAESSQVAWVRGMLQRGPIHSSYEPKPVYYNCGCATARDRRKFLEIDGFDELYFPLYFEDIDLSWRAWKRGWQCLYDPASVVYHACGTSLGRSEKVWILTLRNQLLFHWKNLTDPTYILKHIVLAVPRILAAAFRGDRSNIIAFYQALLRLKVVLQQRKKARKHFRITDAEVVRRINAQSEYVQSGAV